MLSLTPLSQLGCNMRRRSLEVVLARDQDFPFGHLFPLSKSLDGNGKSSKIALPRAHRNRVGLLRCNEHCGQERTSYGLAGSWQLRCDCSTKKSKNERDNDNVQTSLGETKQN